MIRRRRVGETERATGCIRSLNLFHCVFRHAGSVSRLKRARRGAARCFPESSREDRRSATEVNVRESAGAEEVVVDVEDAERADVEGADVEDVEAEGADAINRVPTGDSFEEGRRWLP